MRTPGAFRLEGDEEMMVAGKVAARRNFRQHLADDASQCVLGEDVVTDMVLWHAFFVFAFLSPGCRSGDRIVSL